MYTYLPKTGTIEEIFYLHLLIQDSIMYFFKLKKLEYNFLIGAICRKIHVENINMQYYIISKYIFVILT